MKANIRATPIVVLKGSPIPSVTGLSPLGGAESRAMSPRRCGVTPCKEARVAALAPLPGRSKAATTMASWPATSRAFCCTV